MFYPALQNHPLTIPQTYVFPSQLRPSQTWPPSLLFHALAQPLRHHTFWFTAIHHGPMPTEHVTPHQPLTLVTTPEATRHNAGPPPATVMHHPLVAPCISTAPLHHYRLDSLLHSALMERPVAKSGLEATVFDLTEKQLPQFDLNPCYFSPRSGEGWKVKDVGLGAMWRKPEGVARAW